MPRKLKNIKKSAILAFAVLASSVWVASYASAEEKFNILLIDLKHVVENSLAYQHINKQIEKKAEIHKANATKMQEKLHKKFQEIEAQKSALSKEALAAKNETLAQEAEASQKVFYMERVNLDKAYSNALATLRAKITEIAKKRAEEKHATMVLFKEYTLYSLPYLEITDSVLEELNKTLVEVNVEFESTPKRGDESASKPDNSTKAKKSTSGSKNNIKS